MKHTIVFLDRKSLLATLRPPTFTHVWVDHDQTSADETAARIVDAEIVVANKVKLPAAVLETAPKLKMVAAAATGTDHIDLAYCKAHGIVVSNIRNYAVHAVPEHAFMLMLALRRNLLGWKQDVQAGLWQQAEQFCLFTRPVNDLFGSTLGLVGYGSLGHGMHKLAEAFGMQVLITEHKNAATVRDGHTDFDTVMREADVISLHAPLTPETHHMISTREFGLMKSTEILINTHPAHFVVQPRSHAVSRRPTRRQHRSICCG